MNADQFGHMIRHVAQQGSEATPHRYGHISIYDDKLHRVRCIIPSMTDQDGNPLLSPWMPIGTLSAGNGFGIQIYYFGGATIQNPTGGEQVLIGVFDRHRGVSAVPCCFYHANNLPPSTNLPQDPVSGYSQAATKSLPGDIIISTAPANAGAPNTFVRLRKGGNVESWVAGTMTADVIGDVDLTTETGNINITVSQGNAVVNVPAGNATVTAQGTVGVYAQAIRLGAAAADVLLQLCNSRLWSIFNAHTHPNGGFPDPQAPLNTLTQTLTAE